MLSPSPKHRNEELGRVYITRIMVRFSVPHSLGCGREWESKGRKGWRKGGQVLPVPLWGPAAKWREWPVRGQGQGQPRPRWRGACPSWSPPPIEKSPLISVVYPSTLELPEDLLCACLCQVLWETPRRECSSLSGVIYLVIPSMAMDQACLSVCHTLY